MIIAVTDSMVRLEMYFECVAISSLLFYYGTRTFFIIWIHVYGLLWGFVHPR